MKIAFFGTGDFSKNILKNILKSEKKVEIKLIVSQADKPIGRKKEILPTPVKSLALDEKIEVLQPEKLKENKNFFEKLKSLDLDFIVVVAYGKIIPKEILEIPKFGCINIHGSLLPLYRGASPIQESLKNGDEKTGLTIMFMSEGMDEGDILAKKEVILDILDKTPDVFKKFENFGAKLLLETLEQVISSNLKGEKQDEKNATYCSKIEKKDGEVDFKKETAFEIYNKFRAYFPWPGIYSFYKGKKLSIEDCFFEEIDLDDEEFSPGDVIEIENEHGEKNYQIGIICKKGVLTLKTIKLEGKNSTDIKSFLNGNKDFLDYSF
ncbi:methionyl-tRNA formyltransferase [Candidatus Gracilibacteria bacterium GN02-872]|nr:methionyl-tRNA formyltransferase [Candidatus Gracilibacteria bacterium GN02-872]